MREEVSPIENHWSKKMEAAKEIAKRQRVSITMGKTLKLAFKYMPLVVCAAALLWVSYIHFFALK
jgi:hypothetical protein